MTGRVIETGRCQLVFNQLVRRLGIGNTQQGFREHHHCQAFTGGETEFPHEVLNTAEPDLNRAHVFDIAAGALVNQPLHNGVTGSFLQKGLDQFPVVRRIGRAKRFKIDTIK